MLLVRLTLALNVTLEFSAMTWMLLLVSAAADSWARGIVPLTSWAALRPVNPLPLPEKVPVIVPAEKLPEPSRLTMALAVLTLVAALAAPAPVAMFAADCPPTAETTVALCVPVTSPTRDPEKLVAVVAEFAVVALPIKLPVNEPLATIGPVVRIPVPTARSVGVPDKTLVGSVGYGTKL